MGDFSALQLVQISPHFNLKLFRRPFDIIFELILLLRFIVNILSLHETY